VYGVDRNRIEFACEAHPEKSIFSGFGYLGIGFSLLRIAVRRHAQHQQQK